jgi:predicted ATP-binding protein involved in virulence
MRIRRVQWKNHPILGDLLLDFTDNNSGVPYETVVFAGENGTGKSTILEHLSTFLNVGPFLNFEYIEYVVNGKVYKAVPTTDGNTHPNFFDLQDDSGLTKKIRHDKNNDSAQLQSDMMDIRHYGCVFSRARSDYKTKKITTTSTSELDKEKYDADKSDDFTSLKQLIVDIVNQDNSDYSEANKTLGSAPKSWPDFFPISKLYRFSKSFDSFFEMLTFEKVVDEQGEKTIKFKKSGKSISVDDLSTGEKQIVFRGIYLLRNNKILQDAAIMIDEPELSMHPKWQRKIMQYYKSLFTENGAQNAQLFFATHSDHVLKEALENNLQNIVIVIEHKNNSINAKKIDSPSVLPSITSAETNYLAFDIASNDYHIELFGWLQDKESKNSVKSCDDFIKSKLQYDSVRHSKPSHFRSTTYDTLPTYIRNAIHHPDSGNTFTENELRTSIELLVELCK